MSNLTKNLKIKWMPFLVVALLASLPMVANAAASCCPGPCCGGGAGCC